MSSGDAALEGHTSTLKKTPETHFHEHPVNNSVKIQNALPESGTTREHSVRPPTPEKLEQIKRNGPEEAGRLQGGSISFSESPTGILKTSVDLVDAAAKLIAFLKCVHGWQGNRHGQLYMPGALFSAAEKRYRTVSTVPWVHGGRVWYWNLTWVHDHGSLTKIHRSSQCVSKYGEEIINYRMVIAGKKFLVLLIKLNSVNIGAGFWSYFWVFDDLVQDQSCGTDY